MRNRAPRPPLRWLVGAATLAILNLCTHGVWGAPLDAVLERSRYDENEKREITTLLDRAAHEGIPTEFLIVRIEEAAAKRVPAKRLILALRDEVQRLERAREIIQDAPDTLQTDGVWQRTATLLAWGGLDEEVTSLLTASSGRPRRYTATTSLFVSLVDWNLERALALSLAKAASDSELESDDFPGITRVLAEARRRRERADLTARRLIELLGTVNTLSELEERIKYD